MDVLPLKHMGESALRRNLVNFMEALEQAKERAKPSQKCKVCDWLLTREPTEQDGFAECVAAVRNEAIPVTVVHDALVLAGFDVSYHSVRRHINHASSTASSAS